MDQNQENPQSQTPQSRTPQSQTPQPQAPKPPTPRPPETRTPQQGDSDRGSVGPAATAGGPSSGTPSAGPTPSGASSGASSSGASSSGASSSGAPSGPPQGAPPPAAPPPPGQGPPPPPPSPPPPPWNQPGTADRLSYQLRSLRRSRHERVVAGVCGGVARGLGIDPLLLRVIAVVLTLFGGAGIVLYALGWLLLPVDDGEPSLGTQLTDRRTRRPQSHNVLLAVVLAVAVTLGILSAFRRWDGPLLLALATIGFVVYLLREPSPAALATWPAPTGGAPGGVPGGPSVPTSGATAFAATAPGATAPGATAPGATGLTGSGSTASGSTASGLSGSIASGSTAPMPTTPGMPPVTAGAAPPWQGPPGSPPAPPQPPLPPAPPRERSMLGGLTISAMLLALGVLAAVDGSGVGMPDGAYPALALTVVGIGLLVGAWLGRARGLVWFGLVLAVVTLVATVTTPWQDRHNRQGVDLDLRPTSVSELPADAEYSAGQVRYDLTAVPFEGQSARMGAEIGFGEIVVTVPESVDVTVHASTGLGAIDLLNQDTSGGFGTERTITDLGADGAGGGTLDLDLQAGFGHLEVRRAAA